MSFFSAERFICAICSIPERRGIKGSLSFSTALISLRVGVSICSYVAGNGFLWFFLYGRVMFHFVPVHYLPNAIICPWTFCWYPWLALVKSAEMNIVGPFVFGQRAFLVQIYAQEMDFCVLQWFFITFCIYLDPVVQSDGTKLHPPPTLLEGTLFREASWGFVMCWLTNHGRLGRCLVVPKSSLYMHFSPHERWWSFFSPIAYCPLYRRFQGMSIQDFFPSFTWVVGFVLLLGGVSCWAGNSETLAWLSFGIQIKCPRVVHGRW